jgi:hypothetical protein
MSTIPFSCSLIKASYFSSMSQSLEFIHLQPILLLFNLFHQLVVDYLDFGSHRLIRILSHLSD